MTKISRTALKAQIDADIRVNGNREITPPKHNAIETNIIDSNLNLVDGGWVVEVETGYLTEISLTDNRSFAHKKYIDDMIATISLDDYYKLDGSTPLEGDMDADFWDIMNVGKININTTDTTSALTVAAVNGFNAGKFIADSAGRGFAVVEQADSMTGSGLQITVPSGGPNRLDSYSNVSVGTLSALQIQAASLYLSSYFVDGGSNISIDQNNRYLRDFNGNIVANFRFTRTFSINEGDDSDGAGILAIGDAVTEPTAPSANGSMIWSVGQSLKTNTDFIFTSGQGPIIEDTDNPGTFVRIKYSTAGGFQPEAV